MISRRDLLKTGAAAAAGVFAPISVSTAPETVFDVCIVGSGFAGAFLGLRLAERGVRTVILEAGPPRTAASDADGRTDLFPCAVEGTTQFPVDATRTIAVGGTSRKWNGVVTRLLPGDFRTRTAFGFGSDWPISYDDLVPYYCEAEQALGTRGGAFIPDAEPERRCAYPSQLDPYVSPAPLFAPLAPKFFPLALAAREYGALRLDREQIPKFVACRSATLVADSPVTALLTSDGRHIDGVEVRRPDQTVDRVRARHVVVAAGVVETVRLLLASRSPRFPRGIGNNRRLVGRAFNAHPRYRSTFPLRPGLDVPAGIHRTYSFADPARRAGASACLFDVHFGEPEVVVDGTVELEPIPGNRVDLDDRQRDRWGRAGVVLRADWTERDRRTIARSWGIQRDMIGVLAREPGRVLEPALRWFHPAGGCQMARSAETGIVDRQCQVFGTDNLYVAGASVFPASGATNPTLTLVALALRLGDHLLRRLA